MIARRLEELLGDVGRQNQFLGLAVHEPAAGEASLPHLAYQMHGKKGVLSSNLHYMPYTLQFASRDLTRLTDGFVQGRRMSAEEMLRSFREHLGASDDYERLLSMAYLAGCWQLWDVAEMYCDLALRSHALQKDIPEHEGLFFKAVCLRINAGSDADYARALEFIRSASERKAEVRHPGYEDPRYLKEKAAIILAWHRRFPTSSQTPPSVRVAVDASERALAHVENDNWLASQVVNNLCYFFVNCEIDSTKETQKYYQRLLDALKQISPDYTLWPANYIDTVAWTRFKLRLDKDPRPLIQMLDYAASQPLPDRTKREIEHHLGAIRKSLRPTS
jgi:hypothetical protein